MKVLRITLAVVALLIVVAILAFASLATFVDPNKLKPVLTEEVKKRTGYQLTIDGNLSWAFYPRVSIKIKHMSLSEPNKPQPFLDLNDVKMAVGLPALLRGDRKLQGNLYIANARLGNINAQQVNVDLHWQDKVLTLQSIKANLYQGTFTGLAHGNFAAKIPQWDWNVTFDNIQLQPLLADLNANSKLKLSGMGQVKLIMSTQGKDKDAILNALNGTGELKLTNGIVDGINLNYWIQTANALLNRQPTPAPTDLQQTAFDNLSSSIEVKQGVATTNNLILTAPAFVTTGEGKLVLNAQTIDMALRVKPQQTMMPTATQVSWAVPIVVRGSLAGPDINLDMSDIRAMLLRQEIDKVKAKAREVIKAHVPGKAGAFLQNLLSG